MTFFEKSVLDKFGCLYYLLPPQRDVCDRLRHQSKFYLPATRLHVLVTASLLMDLTITYKYQSPISNDINILCIVYVFIL